MQYIARQPIFDADSQVRAYELLFRESAENRYTGTDPVLATKSTMDTAVLLGLDFLAEGHSIFLNCSYELLVDGYATLFPPDLTVVEILESVDPDRNLVAACAQLKEAGYRIALDDFVDEARFAPLVDLADFIKVDFRLTPPDVRLALVERYSTASRKLLAEKVETREEFSEAVQNGFTLFQGYFFCKPDVLAMRKPPVFGTTHFRILEALGRDELDFVQLEQIIKSEPALCYRLLRYLNSPAFYLQAEVKSILHALLLLGEEEVRKWLLLVFAVIANSATKRELIKSAVVRARFEESLALYAGLSGASAFILGLVSLMDAVLDVPLHSILEQIALPSEVRAALVGDTSRYRAYHEMIVAYESANWEKCDELRGKFRLPEFRLRQSYMEALAWAKRLSEVC